MAIFLTLIAVTAFQLHQNEVKLDVQARFNRFTAVVELRGYFENSRFDNEKICNRMKNVICKDSSSRTGQQEYGTPKQLALFLIGYHVDYRTSDRTLIKTLLDNIHIRFPPEETVRLPPPDETYPALRGLLLIGEKATLPIVEKIKSTDDPSVLSPLAYWFYKYYGRKMALHYLGSLIDESPKMPAEQRQRIVNVMGRISNMPK